MRMITKAQACEYLGIAPSTLRRWEQLGLVRSQPLSANDKRKAFAFMEIRICKKAFRARISKSRWSELWRQQIQKEMESEQKVSFLRELPSGLFRDNIYNVVFCAKSSYNNKIHALIAQEMCPHLLEFYDTLSSKELCRALALRESFPYPLVSTALNDIEEARLPVYIRLYRSVYMLIKRELGLT